MIDHSVSDCLKVEELYKPVVEALYASGRYPTTTAARSELDRILSMGKVIGCRTALDDVPQRPSSGEVWAETSGLGQVEIMLVSSADIVHYRNPGCGCGKPFHETEGHPVASSMATFLKYFRPVERYDKLIDQWLGIVDLA